MQLIPEQIACVEAASQSNDNLIISALAGAAKTTTLVEMAKAMPNANGICIAFNKSIATEMQKKLPSNFKAMTLHSLGMRVWRDKVGKVSVDAGKMMEIYKELIQDWTNSEQNEFWDAWQDIRQVTNEAKAFGHLPDAFYLRNERKCIQLMDDFTLFEESSISLSSAFQKLVLEALTISADRAMNGMIDFDDMVLFPALFRCMYPMNNLVLVDEAQDMSELNLMMLEKLTKRRIIAVGDQCQAIYGFRGAHGDGMRVFKQRFNMTELTLPVSFRCPEAIVDHVRWRAPHMRTWEGNTVAGAVTYLPQWSLDDIPDGAYVICRNNAPLFNLAMKLMRSGRYPNLWGRDMGKGLLRTLKSLGPKNMTRDSLLSAIDKWHAQRKKKVKDHSSLTDRVECLKIFARAAKDLGGAYAYGEQLINSPGHINLMTAHKSKGHEAKEVFILDNELFRDRNQDDNLRYVAATRSLKNLTYIKMEDLKVPDAI